jgi:hypothetical protein
MAFQRKLRTWFTPCPCTSKYYDFGRIYKTLRVPPAMEAGVSCHAWNLEEIVGLAV